MATYVKSVPDIVAEITNQNLIAGLYFDPEPPNELYFKLRIRDANGIVIDSAIVRVDDVLSAGDRTTLNGIMVQLRDAALTAGGYTAQ